MSQEFTRTESISGALFRSDDFLQHPPVQGHSETAPGTSRNAYSTNHGTNEDDSQSDRHPEAGMFQSQTTQNSGPEDVHDMVTGVQEKIIIFEYCRSSSFCLISDRPNFTQTANEPFQFLNSIFNGKKIKLIFWTKNSSRNFVFKQNNSAKLPVVFRWHWFLLARK